MIKHFPENSIIRSIGTIYKESQSTSWNIKLQVEDLVAKKTYEMGTRFSNMHLIARGRCLKPTTNVKLTKPLILTYKIEDLKQWNNSCNIYTQQNQLSQVMTDDEHRYKSICVHLPKLELARALFFHNAYFARNALNPQFLDLEFDVKNTKDHCVIRQLIQKSFPKVLYDSVEMRSALAWILVNLDIRESYKSISTYFHSQKHEYKSITTWNFDFDCPSLRNAEIKVKAYYSKELNQIYINEIIEINNIQSGLPELVEFSSPDFIKNEKGSSNDASASYRVEKTLEAPNIDDRREASSDKSPIFIKSEPVLLSFQQPIRTTKRYIKRKGTNTAFGEEQEDIFDDLNVVATDEPTILGTIGQGEFMGLKEDDEHIEYMSEGFKKFKEMICNLDKSGVIELKSTTPYYHRLPKVGKSRLHYTYTDQPRSVLEFQFHYKHKNFSIFEINLDDQAKNISTLIIQWNSNLNPTEEIIKELSQLIVKRSLRWPDKKMLLEWGVFKTINHPKKSNDSLSYTQDEIELWQDNIKKHLSKYF